MRTTMFLFLAASLAVACGKKDSGKGEGGGGSSGPAVGTPAAEVNALVPKDKAGALTFEYSSRYFYCRAKLDKEALPFLAAFEKACRMVHISSWD